MASEMPESPRERWLKRGGEAASRQGILGKPRHAQSFPGRTRRTGERSQYQSAVRCRAWRGGYEQFWRQHPRFPRFRSPSQMSLRLNRSTLLARLRSLGMPLTIPGELGKHAPKVAVIVFQNGLGIDPVDTQCQKTCRLDVSLGLLKRACRARRITMRDFRHHGLGTPLQLGI